MTLHIRRLVRWVDNADRVQLHRILEVHPELGIICTFDCTDPPRVSRAQPIQRSLSDFQAALRNGTALLLDTQDDLLCPGDDTQLSPRARAAQARNYQLIEHLVEQHSVLELTNAHIRAKLIRQACVNYTDASGKTHQVSKNTVWVQLRAWWRGGMVRAALVPQYQNCGAAPPKPGSRRVGRKPSTPEGRLPPIDHALSSGDIENLQDGFEKFRIKKKLPLSTAYSNTLLKHWPLLTLTSRDKVEPILPIPGTAPSFGQWYYHGQKLLESGDKERRDKRFRQLYGSGNFDNNMRPEMIGVSRLSEGFGWLCQYDATPFPIKLVRDDDRSKEIGGPLLFTMTDVKTHYIFDPFITLESESFSAAQRALYEISRRHEEGEERVTGMPLELGLPKVLAVDRGPYMALDSSHLTAMLGVRIEQGRSYFPLARMLVETTHRMLELLLKELAGTYDWHIDEESGRKLKIDGVFTLTEFQKAVRLAVNYLNEWSEIENYPFDSDMIEANIRPYRLDLMEFCRANRPGGFHTWPEDYLALHLMPSGEARVTPKGLLYERQYYTCERAAREDWFGEEQRRRHQKGKSRSAKKVAIARHWLKRDVIYLRLPNQQTLEPCSLMDERSAWRGKTWADYNHWKASQEALSYDEDHLRMQARLDLSKQFQEMNESAQAQAKKARQGQSRSKIQAERGCNRTAEKTNMRQNDLLPKPSGSPENPPDPVSEPKNLTRPQYGTMLRKAKNMETCDESRKSSQKTTGR